MIAPPEVTIREVQKVDDEKIIELHQKHVSLRNIAKQLGYSLYAVQKVTSTWDAQVKAITDESRAKEKKAQPADWREQT